MSALLIPTLLKHAQRIVSSALSHDGKKLALAVLKDRDAHKLPAKFNRFIRVIVIDTVTGALLHEADTGEKRPNSTNFALALSPNGELLAAGGPWTISVWSVGNPKAIWNGEGNQGRIQSLAFSADGKQIATTNEDKAVLVWDLAKS